MANRNNRLTEVKVWCDQKSLDDNKGLLKSMQAEFNGSVELDEVILTGEGFGDMRMGVNYERVLQKWLDMRVNDKTKGGEKATGFLKIESDASLLDIITALPEYAKFKAKATDGRGHFHLTMTGIKSASQNEESSQKVAIRVCDLDYRG